LVAILKSDRPRDWILNIVPSKNYVMASLNGVMLDEKMCDFHKSSIEVFAIVTNFIGV